MVPTPVAQVALFDAGGISNQYSPNEERAVRVSVRGDDRSEAITLADQVYDLLHCGGGAALLGVDLTSFHVYTASAITRPQAAGVDENNEPLMAFNCDCRIRAL